MQEVATIFAGPTSQTGSLHHWGDFSAMTVDAVVDCTFWLQKRAKKPLLSSGGMHGPSPRCRFLATGREETPVR
jgi:hypothetical protein